MPLATAESNLADDVLIVAVEWEDGVQPITPKGNTRIQTGVLLTVYSGDGADPDPANIFGHHVERGF